MYVCIYTCSLLNVHVRTLFCLCLKKYESPGNRAALLYLRAMFQAASGNIPNAVQDFFSLESHDVRLFPFE